MAKVLVVDDEKSIVKGIRYSLLQDNYEVDCAYDGEEALAMARTGNYDIALLDVMLPKMSGTEVCQAIREFSDLWTRFSVWNTARMTISRNLLISWRSRPA